MGISIQSTSTTSVTLFLTGLDTSWTNGTRTAYWYLGSPNGGTPTENAYHKSKTASISDGVSSGGQVTFTGLEPDTDYGVYCAVYHDSTFLKSWQGYVSTDKENSGGGSATSIVVWSWSESNGSASKEQTIKAYNATSVKGAVSDFSHLVWNDMVDKCKEILDAINSSWDSRYASYTNTKMTTSDRVLTAERFNSLRYNIGSHYSTGIEEVAKGDIVYGGKVRSLGNFLIMWINELQG